MVSPKKTASAISVEKEKPFVQKVPQFLGIHLNCISHFGIIHFIHGHKNVYIHEFGDLSIQWAK